MSKVTRRTLLGTGAAALAATSFSFPSLKELPANAARKPKNIIFCVADGMAMQTLSLADLFQARVLGHRSYWNWLASQDFAVNGLQMTASLSSVVTDSAAASSAWGSGRHIWNGQLNVFPDGTKLRTLHSLFREHKVKTGLVTTTTITHATPAGFAINCDDRDKEWEIADRYLEGGFDVLMGGGDKHFNPTKRKDKKDTYAGFAQAGYKVAKSRDEILNARAAKILGVFWDGHLPYTVDRMHNAEMAAKVPTLAEMARTAIDNLKGSSEGFVLQIEGGKVDHAGHANDLGSIIWEQIAFEEAVKVAIDFALQDGETLVVITADHATGGPSLNGDGDEYFDTSAAVDSFVNLKASYDTLVPAFGKTPIADSVRDVVAEKLGIQLTADEAKGVADGFAGQSPMKFSKFHGNRGGTLATALGNHTKVGWTSGNHTAEHVMVTAVGPGNAQWRGVTENVHYFDWLLGMKDIRHSNPTMTFAEAKAAMDKKHAKAQVEEDIEALEFGVHA